MSPISQKVVDYSFSVRKDKGGADIASFLNKKSLLLSKGIFIELG